MTEFESKVLENLESINKRLTSLEKSVKNIEKVVFHTDNSDIMAKLSKPKGTTAPIYA